MERGRAAAGAVWVLDAFDVARKWLRGTLHAERRGERRHAAVQARVLRDLVVGRSPPRPDAPRAV
jgi:hypothetical protein